MSDELKLKNLINGMMSQKGRLSKGYNQYNVEAIWRETFGSMISSYTSSVRFSKGVMTVYITSAPLRQEIDATKETIINRINQKLPHNKVTSLIVR